MVSRKVHNPEYDPFFEDSPLFMARKALNDTKRNFAHIATQEIRKMCEMLGYRTEDNESVDGKHKHSFHITNGDETVYIGYHCREEPGGPYGRILFMHKFDYDANNKAHNAVIACLSNPNSYELFFDNNGQIKHDNVDPQLESIEGFGVLDPEEGIVEKIHCRLIDIIDTPVGVELHRIEDQ